MKLARVDLLAAVPDQKQNPADQNNRGSQQHADLHSRPIKVSTWVSVQPAGSAGDGLLVTGH